MDALADEESEPRETLLCSVCHGEGHLSKNEGIPRRKKGNHSLPQNLQKKKSPYPAPNNKLMSFLKEHNILEEKALEMLKPYCYKHLGETTNKLDGDTSTNRPWRLEP